MTTYVQFCGQDAPGLYLVQTRSSPRFTCDIFFVHGLGGGPTQSWVHPSTRRIWFQDLLPDHVADEQLGINARIWTFGYNAGLASSARASIYDYSRQLLNRVNGVRDGHEHHKIIWICHSLGGLVVKWALIEAQINLLYRSILESTVGIVFLGTPHQGSNAASFATILARIAERTLLVRPPTELLRTLTRDSDVLDQSWRQFPNICQHIKICSFYETLTMGRNIIVERSSALTNMPGEEQCALNANHSDLCKFSDHNDQNFVVVCDAIKRFMRLTVTDAAVSAVETRPLPALPQSNPTASIVSSLSNPAALEQPVNQTDTIPPNPQLNLAHMFNLHASLQTGSSVPPPQCASGYQGQLSQNIAHLALTRVVTNRDVPQLIRELTTTEYGAEHGSRISAAAHLARIAQTSEGRDHVATAVNADVIRLLVGYLSDSGILRQHAVVILAVVLYFEHSWTPALSTRAIPLLVGLVSDPSLDTSVSAACALAHITRSDAAKKMAAEAGAIPPLVAALGCPSSQLKQMAVRAIRNITVVDAGRRAAHDSSAVQGLVALLDDPRLSLNVQYDVVSSLAMIAAHNRAARKKMKKAGAFQKLSRFKNPNVPENLQKVAVDLRDELR